MDGGIDGKKGDKKKIGLDEVAVEVESRRLPPPQMEDHRRLFDLSIVGNYEIYHCDRGDVY